MRRKNVRKSRNDGGNHGKKEVVSKSSGEIKFGQDEIAKHELMRHRIDNSSNTPQEYDVSTKEQVKAPSTKLKECTKNNVQDIQDLVVGSEFTSFNEVQRAIDTFQKKNFVQFYKSDSLHGYRSYSKKCPKRKFNPDLRYSELDFRCVHGGKKFKSMSKGVRPKQRYS
jgi:zinc finger SWIM domain-containing protein 3